MGSSKVRLDIVVVGAGLSGLAAAVESALAGHIVTVLESVSELAPVRDDTRYLANYPS